MSSSILSDRIEPLLDPGEKLIWIGRPRPGISLSPTDFFLVPFAIVWLGMVTIALIVSVRSGQGFPIIMPVMLLLIGLYVFGGRFWFDGRRRKNTTYALTNERVIIKSGIIRKSVKSLNLRTLSDLTLNEKPNGSGTIYLGPQAPWFSGFQIARWPGMSPATSVFERIDDAKQVYDQLRRAQKES